MECGRILLIMRLAVVIFVLAAALDGQEPPAGDSAATLLEVRKRVMQSIRRLPKFLCTQTIDRATFQPDTGVAGRSCEELEDAKKWKRRPYSSDRLRLDVSVSSDGEMYSWVGENRFQDRSLAELVGGGATSTGAFSSFLSSIFGGNSAEFTYEGASNAGGRALVQFGFSMPVEKSGYSIGNARYRANVPYHGTILVDPKTFDPVRITIEADRLPRELDVCRDSTILEYDGGQRDNLEFLLPTDAYLHIVYDGGTEIENHTRFSGCHQFMGEATLRFDDASDREAAAAKAESKPLVLPPGLPFKIALTEAIETATAAAGDLIHAKLTTPIVDPNSGISIPKGAKVTGRLIHIERFYGPYTQALTVSIRMETVEAGGVPQPFPARLDSLAKGRRDAGAAETPRVNLGTFNRMEEQASEQEAGVLLFDGAAKNYVIRRGVEIVGKTKRPAAQ